MSLSASRPQTSASASWLNNPAAMAILMNEADFVALQHRETGFTDEIRRYLRGRTPVYRLIYRGIPLLDIYEH